MSASVGLHVANKCRKYLCIFTRAQIHEMQSRHHSRRVSPYTHIDTHFHERTTRDGTDHMYIYISTHVSRKICVHSCVCVCVFSLLLGIMAFTADGGGGGNMRARTVPSTADKRHDRPPRGA